MSYSHISVLPRPSPGFRPFRLLGLLVVEVLHWQRSKLKAKPDALHRLAALGDVRPTSDLLAVEKAVSADISWLAICSQDRTETGGDGSSPRASVSQEKFFAPRVSR